MLIAETKTPPAGWNSFDCYMGSINEEQALANLELFLKKLKPAGYEYFCLDAAWYADGDQAWNEQLRNVGQCRNMHIDCYGRFVPSPVNFPHGVRALADRCHENGVKFGVHIMRGMPRMALEQNTPIKGTDFRARDIYDPNNFCPWCKYWVATDASHPGTFAYYRSEVEYLTEELTVDFIKLDDVVEHPDHVALFGKALDSVARPVLLSLSPGAEDIWRGSWKEYVPYGNMIRVTPDAWDDDRTNLIKLRRWYEFEDLSGSGYAAAGGVAGDNSAGAGTSDGIGAAEQAYPDREEGDDDDLCDELFAVDFRRGSAADAGGGHRAGDTPGDAALQPERRRGEACQPDAPHRRPQGVLQRGLFSRLAGDFQFEQRCAAGETFCVAAGI